MKRLLICLSLFVIPAVFGFQAIPNGDTNARLKSVFIYNFTRYIDWPADYKAGDFVINMYGNNAAMFTELNNMAKTKTVGAQKIVIRNTTSLDGIGKCNILYVTSEVSTPISEILGKIKGKATLLVTEQPGFAKKGSASIGKSVRPGNAGRRGVKIRYLHETSSVVHRVQNPSGQG